MKFLLAGVIGLSLAATAFAESPFEKHGRIRVAKSGTYLEHADGAPFFFLADTCWTGPALSSEKDWDKYLADRKKKGFSAVQFNMVSPWRTAPTDAEGNVSYTIKDEKLTLNEPFYKRLDARLKAINDAGLLAVPVLVWAHKKGDAGKELTDEQLIDLCKLEVERYSKAHVLWILAGDNQYTADADRWKKIGRAVFGEKYPNPVTTHPTGENFPWAKWEDEKWLTVLGYQSGHGDSENAMKWMTEGPIVEYGKRKEFARPIINLEPPYEGHLGYSNKKPHSDLAVRRAIYWSLLSAPVAGVTYGGHGVWSWHTKAGAEPTDHPGTGVAKVWSEALDLPGAGQMKHVRDFFEAVDWTTLRPDHRGCTQPEGTKSEHRVVCAKSLTGGLYVYYFPPGATAAIHLHIRGQNDAIRWFDPRTGKWGIPENAKPKPGLFNPPTDDHDWLLVVKP